ncbi:MAG: hypothetical protein IPP39_10040 [Chitinophagaceae bacterium]|nr:hypothetical protein [Chitinophagaceae bacterium]
MKKFTFLFVFAFVANLILSSTAFGQILQRGTSTNGTSTNASLQILSNRWVAVILLTCPKKQW